MTRVNLIFHFFLQRVHNGDHKCSKGSQAENSGEKTIPEVFAYFELISIS